MLEHHNLFVGILCIAVGIYVAATGQSTVIFVVASTLGLANLHVWNIVVRKPGLRRKEQELE
ncbi:MAG: hypothetical protein PVJ94_04050 [Flavobacteriales bacterium]|jgi:hypothetical protein